MKMLDVRFDDELNDVIDITDEDTLLYSPSPPSSPRQNNHNDVIVIDEDTVTTVLNSQPQPTTQQKSSLKSASTVNEPPLLTKDEDLDLVEVIRHIDVVVVDDDVFENNGEDSVVIVTEDEEKATAPNSLLQFEESHSNKRQDGTASKKAVTYFNSLPGASLQATPATPSYSRDIKDTYSLQLESKEIALSLKSQQALSSDPAAMVVIPAILKKEEDNLDNVIDSLKELLNNKVEFKPLPTYSTSSTSLISDNTYSKKSPSSSTNYVPQRLYSKSGIFTDHNPSTTKLLSTYLIEENPLEGPSSLLDDHTRSTLNMSSMDIPQTTSLSNVPSANMKIQQLNEQMSSPNETSTTNILTLPHKEVLHIQSPISELSIENATLTLSSSLSQLSASKSSIFESPEIYQCYYKKSSPEIRKILDRLFLHHKNSERIFNKYFYNHTIQSKNDTINVKNNDNVNVTYQNSKINENTDKLEETSSNDLHKVNHDKSQNKIVKNEEHKTTGETLSCYSDLELKNVCKTVIEKNVHFEVPQQPNLSIILKKSCVNNKTSNESESEKFETEVNKIHLENNDPSDVVMIKSKRKRCSTVPSENKKVFDNTNTNTNYDFPRSKKPKNYGYSLARNDDNDQIVSNKNFVKYVAEMSSKGPNSSQKLNKDELKRLETVQILPKREQKDKLIKMYETNTCVPNQNENHKLSTSDLLPCSSKQPVEKVKKKTSSKRLSESVYSDRNVSNKPIYSLVPQRNNSESHLEITLKMACPVHCTCDIHSRRELNPTLNTHNYMPCQAGFQYYGVNAPNNISYPKIHQKSTLSHNFQPQLVNASTANYLKTVTEPPHFNTPNYPAKMFAPKCDPRLLLNANIEHNNNMMNISMAQISGYLRGAPHFNNILEVPATSTRDPNNSYMTVNGAPPVAHSQADSISRLKSGEIRRENDYSVAFNYYMPPRLPTPPHYKPF